MAKHGRHIKFSTPYTLPFSLMYQKGQQQSGRRVLNGGGGNEWKKGFPVEFVRADRRTVPWPKSAGFLLCVQQVCRAVPTLLACSRPCHIE